MPTTMDTNCIPWRVFAAAFGALGLLGAGRNATAQIPSSVEFRVPKPPTVAVNDSGGFVAYELHITNLTTNPMTLRRVDVVNGASNVLLASVAGDALLPVIARPGLRPNASQHTTIGPGLRAIAYIWFQVNAQKPPAILRHRLTFQQPLSFQRPLDTTSRTASADTIQETLEGAVIPVERRAVAISPPLRGRWLAPNGPSQSSGHRRLVLALNGAVASGQRFGIDYLQIDDNGNTTRSDRSKNENFYAYGAEALAVGNGVVVETKDSIPENVPGGRAVAINLETVGGNHVLIDLGQSRFAFYAHLQPGSLQVKVGDRVRAGQVIGLVGNSGNSTEPHLHFHISDGIAAGTTTLGAEGIPYALQSLEILGRCGFATRIACTTSAPVVVRGGMPMQNQLVRFP